MSDDDAPQAFSSLKARFEQLAARQLASPAPPTSAGTSPAATAGARVTAVGRGTAGGAELPGQHVQGSLAVEDSGRGTASSRLDREDGEALQGNQANLVTRRVTPLVGEGAKEPSASTTLPSEAPGPAPSPSMTSARPAPPPPPPPPPPLRAKPSTTAPSSRVPSPPSSPAPTSASLPSANTPTVEGVGPVKRKPPPPIPTKLVPASSPAPKPTLAPPPAPATTTPSEPPMLAPALDLTPAAPSPSSSDDQQQPASVSALRSRFGASTLSATRGGPTTPSSTLREGFLSPRPGMPPSSNSASPAPASTGPPPVPANRPHCAIGEVNVRLLDTPSGATEGAVEFLFPGAEQTSTPPAPRSRASSRAAAASASEEVEEDAPPVPPPPPSPLLATRPTNGHIRQGAMTDSPPSEPALLPPPPTTAPTRSGRPPPPPPARSRGTSNASCFTRAEVKSGHEEALALSELPEASKRAVFPPRSRDASTSSSLADADDAPPPVPPPPPLLRTRPPSRERSTFTTDSEGATDPFEPPPALAPRQAIPPRPSSSVSGTGTPKPPLPARKNTSHSSFTVPSPLADVASVVVGPPAPDLPPRVPSAQPTATGKPPAPPRLPERSRTVSAAVPAEPGAVEEPYVPPPPPPLRSAGAGTVMPSAAKSPPRRGLARSISRVAVPFSARAGAADAGVSTKDEAYHPPPPPLPPPPQRVDSLRPAATPAPEADELDGDDSDEDDASPSGTASPSSGAGGGLHRAVSVSARKVDDYPDPTLSNRLPPTLRHRPPVIRHASGHTHPTSFACADNYVAVGSYHLRVYDAESVGLELVCKLDQREIGLEVRSKDARVTALCFRPGSNEGEGNRWLWAGTNEGHLFEVDVWSSVVTQTKAAPVHSHASSSVTSGSSSSSSSAPVAGEITHIWAYKGNMLVLDESGRCATYRPNADGLFNLFAPAAQPRIADRPSFAACFGGAVWTSAGPGGSSGSRAKLPNIRIYEPFAAHAANDTTDDVPPPSSSSNAASHTVFVPDSISGAVLCGTIVPSRPDSVYLAHEGGQISAWSRMGGVFEGVVKVGASSVTCLAGVGDRLWAGGRKGLVSVFDVETKPWTVTNMWAAHEKDTPVIGLQVDPTSIRNNMLKVYSWGRDDCVHAWDGLLEEDWIDKRLLEREAEFCSFRNLKVISCSYNMDAAKPADLSSSTENASFLANVLTSEESPDIVVFGFQEIIPLEDKKLAAKSFLFGKAKGSNNEMSDKVSQRYRNWHDKLVQAMRVSLPPDSPYTVVHAQNLVGLFTCIFVKNAEVINLRDISITTVKRGMAGMLGNKGAILARFVVDDSSICFINCHLAAGQNQKMARNADLASILDEEARFPTAGFGPDELAFGGGDGSMVLDHDICLLQGDLNYRIDLRRETVINSIRAGERVSLLGHDQLLKEMRSNPGFRLRTFSEAPIAFDPTYKYNRGTHDYDTSVKQRVPAWCDRILYRSRVPGNIEALHYTRYEPTLSDHKPISAGFDLKVRRVRERERFALKALLANQFAHEVSGPILDAQMAFYSALL